MSYPPNNVPKEVNKQLKTIIDNAREKFDKLDEAEQSKYAMTWDKGMKMFVETYYDWFKVSHSNPKRYAILLRYLKNSGFTGAVLAFACDWDNEVEDEEEEENYEELSSEKVEEIKNNLPAMFKFKQIMKDNPPSRQSA